MFKILSLVLFGFISLSQAFASQDNLCNESKELQGLDHVLYIQHNTGSIKNDVCEMTFTIREYKENEKFIPESEALIEKGPKKGSILFKVDLKRSVAESMRKAVKNGDYASALGNVQFMFPFTFNQIVENCTKDSFDFSGLK